LIKLDLETEEPILDKDGNCIRCEFNEPGELLGKIDNNPNSAYGTFTGYHNNPNATKKKILGRFINF
jgi:fatty-acyl-CoA synthase